MSTFRIANEARVNSPIAFEQVVVSLTSRKAATGAAGMRASIRRGLLSTTAIVGVSAAVILTTHLNKASAQSATWNGTTTDYGTTTNWTPNTVPLSGGAATFNGAGSQTVDLGATSYAPGSVNVTGGTYTFQNGSFTDTTLSLGNGTVTQFGAIGAARTATTSTSAGGFAVTHSGTVTLINTGTISTPSADVFNGNGNLTLLNSGTISSGSLVAVNTSGNGTVTNAAGGILQGGSNTGYGSGVNIFGTATVDNFGSILGGATGSNATLQVGSGSTVNLRAGSTTTSILLGNSSSLSLYNGTGTGSAAVVDPSGIVLQAAGTNAAAAVGNIAFGSGGRLNLRGAGNGTAGNGAAGTINMSTVTGLSSLTKSDTGTWTVMGTNTSTGGTTFGGGILLLGSTGALGTTGTLSFTGGALQYSGFNLIDYSSRFSTAASQAYNIDTSNLPVTFATGLTSIGGSLTKSGTGTLTLTGANTYSGGTTISAGILRIGSGGTSGAITGNVVDNAVLAFNRSDTLTYGGIISGTGSVNQIGTGTTTLTGANSYTGGTTVSAGALQIGSGSAAGAITGNVALSNGAALSFNRSDAVAFAGVISGSGAINQIGMGTTTLTGNNTYTGDTRIFYGILQIGDGGTTGTLGTGNISNGSTLAFNRSNALTISSVISNVGSVQQIGAGTTTLTGANDYNGETMINAGTLVLNNASGTAISDVSRVTFGNAPGTAATLQAMTNETIGSLAGGNTSSTVAIAAGTTLTVGGDTTTAGYAGAINVNGTGVLAKTGSGTQTLNGAITGGSLQVMDNGGALALGPQGTFTTNGVALYSSFGLTGVGIGTGATFSNAGTITLTGVNNDGVQLAGGTFNNTGTLTGAGLSAIYALLGGTISNTGQISGGNGVFFGNNTGTSSLIVTGGGSITGTNGYGIGADNGSGNVTLGTTIAGQALGNVTGNSAISARTSGGGSIGIVTGGTVTSNNGIGINASSVNGAVTVTQTAGTVQATGSGIVATSTGTGAVTATARTINTTNGSGLVATGTSGAVTTIANGAITAGGAGNAGIFLTGNNAGNTATVAAGATVQGAIGLRVAGTGTTALANGGTIASSAPGGNAVQIDGGTLVIGETAGAFTGNLAAVITGSTLAVNRTTGLTLANTITGAGVLNQTGSGTTTLTGANSAGNGQFTGTANVNAGTLSVNGTFGDTATRTAVVNVNNGGTLHGAGTIAGSVAVANGGTVSAGNSPGTLTVAQDYTLAAGSTSLFELGTPGVVGGTDNDLINVGRNLTLGGTLSAVSSANGAASPVAGEYRLYTYGGTLTGAFASVTTPTAQSATVLTNIAGQVNLLIANAGQSMQYWDGADTTGATAGGQGGAGTWSTASTNWTASPTSQVDNAWRSGVGIFGGTAGTVTIAGAQDFQGLQFTVDGYQLAGAGTLNLTGDSFSTATQSFVNVDAGVGVTIANAITSTGGAFGLVKLGTGTLTLAGTSTFTGDTTVSAGTLAIAAGGSITSNVSNAATFSNAGTVTGTFSNSGTASNSGTVTGAATVSGGSVSNTGAFGSTLGLTGGSFTNNTDGSVAGTATNNGGTLTNNGGTLADVINTSGSFANTSGTAGAVTNASTATNAGTIASLINSAGTFGNTGTVTGASSISGGTVTNNGGSFAAVTNTSGSFINTSGTAGALSNAATATNAGTIASLANSAGTFGNTGTVTGASSISGGTVTNTNVFASTLGLTGGTFTNTGGSVAGATTNNGGTVTNSGGTLAAVTNSSGSFVNAAGSVAGAVSNASTATNAGTVASLVNSAGTFGNTGTITGATNVSGGTLTTSGTLSGGLTNSAMVNANGGAVNGAIANNAGAFNVGGTVTSNNTFANASGATLAIAGTGRYTLQGLLTNAGTLTVANGGQLTATAGGLTNAKTGTVTVAQGSTLRDDLNNAGSVTNNGNYIANVAFNSGSIANTATGIWTGNVASNSGSLSNSGTWTGSIVTSGTFANAAGATVSGLVTNSGTTTNAGTFNGGLTNTAGTTTNSGVINGPVIVSGGTLTGSGRTANLTVSSGIFAPGNGTAGSSMTVNGNLALASALQYVVQINPATASFTNVTGTAALGGAAVTANFASGSYVTRQYTILTAAGGRTGTFGALTRTNLPANFNANLSYDANRAFLDLTLDYTRMGGLIRNQQNVANTLTGYFNRTGGIPMAFGSLSAAGLSQVSGELGTGTQQTTFDAMGLFMGLLTDPSSAGRGGAAPQGAIGYADEARAPSDAMAAMSRKAPATLQFEERWNVWTAGFGGSQTTDGNAATGSSTASSRIYGGAVGADYRISPNTTAGFALAGGGTNFSVANGSGRSDLFQAGGFVRHTVGATYLTAALAYGWQDVTTDRSVGADRLHARFSSNALSGRLEAGHRLVEPVLGMGLTPYAAIQVTSVSLPNYSETNGAVSTFGLNYAAKDATATRSEFGLRTDKAFAVTNGVMTLRSRAAWAHNFDPDRSITATFQSLPGASFVVNGAAQAREAALVTGSAEMSWLNGWTLAGTFEGEFSNVTRSYAGKGVVRYGW